MENPVAFFAKFKVKREDDPKERVIDVEANREDPGSFVRGGKIAPPKFRGPFFMQKRPEVFVTFRASDMGARTVGGGKF